MYVEVHLFNIKKGQ